MYPRINLYGEIGVYAGEEELRQLARKHIDNLTQHPVANWSDVCFSSNTGGSSLPCRLAIIAADAEGGRFSWRTM